MASPSRRVKRELERRFKRLRLKREVEFVYTSMFEDIFGQGDPEEKRNHRGEISLVWIQDNLLKFVTGIRNYQRFKVKDLIWKQTIVQDVLLSGIRVAELIIRVIMKCDDKGKDVLTFEVVDGQQRIVSFIEFMNDEFTIDIDGKNMKYSEMETEASALYHQFNELAFGALFYENITYEEASIIFKKVNDQTDINCQEDRHAIYGPYSTYIADRTYYGTDKLPVHPLFTITEATNKNGTSKKDILPNFPKLKIEKSRMEQCEWFSHLIHWKSEGLRNTTNQDTHTLWQMNLDPYAEVYDGKKQAEHLLKIANDLMTAASPDQKEYDMTPMVLQLMTLWFDELTSVKTIGNVWSIVKDDFVNGFLSCVDDYSHEGDEDRKRAENKERCRSLGPGKQPWKLWSASGNGKVSTNGKPVGDMGKMSDLFGGHNQKAIMTILSVLEYELNENPKQFGAILLDPQETFSKDMIIKKWKDQDKRDAKSGLPLDFTNLEGDHIIPRSNGIDAGGVTTWENLQVIARNRNRKKGNSSEITA